MILLDCVSILAPSVQDDLNYTFLKLRDVRLVHYQCFFLWRSSKQVHGIHLRQERLREYLYMALNTHIAVIKCVKDLCCELAVKHHSKYSTAPV